MWAGSCEGVPDLPSLYVTLLVITSILQAMRITYPGIALTAPPGRGNGKSTDLFASRKLGHVYPIVFRVSGRLSEAVNLVCLISLFAVCLSPFAENEREGNEQPSNKPRQGLSLVAAVIIASPDHESAVQVCYYRHEEMKHLSTYCCS